ncbi:MAG: EthD family reductase [Sphingomonas sp.]|nr:MAG: EthD family reductase [Sphingomonas sp.]
MIKLSFFLTRRSDLTHEQFTRYWLDRHAPLLEGLPEVQLNVRKYVQQDALKGLPPSLPVAPFDGVAELWFDDMEALNATLAAGSYATLVAEDEEKFLDRSKTSILLSVARHGVWQSK